jgi:phage terminase small subunit
MANTTGNPHGLTDLQVKFCREYAKDLNATKAYLRAGYGAKTDASAAASSCALLRSPKIKAYLGEILSLSEVSVISEIAKIAFANLTDIVELKNNSLTFKDTSEISDRAKGALQSITVSERYTEEGKVCTVQVKMHDKLAALEKLMKRLRLYPKEMTTMGAVTHLVSQGLLTDEQARVIVDGVSGIEEGLRSLASERT